MTGITLNLASRPFRNNSIVGSVLAAVVVALIAATVYNGFVFLNYGGRYRLLQGEERQHRERLAALEKNERELSRQIQSRDFRRLYGRGVFAGDLILRRSFSWTLLFNRLEDLVPPEVMMTAIRPNITGEKTVIRVDGIAKNHGGLIALEDKLLKNPVFARVNPIYERRVNPNRPEIDFALEFDYFPGTTPPGPDAIAAGAAPAKSPAPEKEAAQASPTPSTIAAAPTPGPEAGSAAAPPAGPRPVIGTVGRDGRPRTPELLARVIAAPGGFYPQSPPEPTPAPADTSTKRPKGKPHDSRPAPSRNTPDVAPASATAASPATWHDGASTAQAGQPLVAGRPQSHGANPGRTSARMNRGTIPRTPGPIPAMRLDVPLTFSARPVGDIYAALSTAHAVRIEIDPTVDRRARVTADLSGKSLNEAFASVSKMAGHKVVRVGDGLYRVVPLAGGEPLGDHPVQEEPLPGSEVKP